MVVRKRFGAAFARSNVARGVNGYLKARGGALDEQPLIGIDNKTDRNVYYGKGSAALRTPEDTPTNGLINQSIGIPELYDNQGNPFAVTGARTKP